MHKCEVNVVNDAVYGVLLEEALYRGVRYVEAIETQRKRQILDGVQTDAMQNILTDFYMKEAPKTDVLNDILTLDRTM